jgi:acyl-CoA synthetase (NDP forming)
MASLAAGTQQALRDMLPPGAAVAGPVDTTAAVTPGLFRRCLELVGADPGVDAVLALMATTATGDLVPEVPAARLPVPVAAVAMDQVEVVRLLPGPGDDSPDVPAYAYPESAARALGHAARYGTWLATPPGQVPDLGGLRPDRAKELVDSFLADAPKGGWLSLDQTAQLLSCYGVRLVDRIAVSTPDAAAEAAARFGTPVALKADLPSVIRPLDAGAVLLDLRDAEEVRRGFRSLRETFAGRLTAVFVEPMITGGVTVRISILQEEVFGPLVLFGPGGATAGALAGRAARFAPLTGSDADDLIRSAPAAPLLLARPGAPAADLAALRDMLLRISRMAGDLPQIAELELPAAARPDGIQALDARARIQTAEPTDAYLRQLP